MLWEVDIYPRSGCTDLRGRGVAADAHDMQLAAGLEVASAHGYLIQGDLDRAAVDRLVQQLLSDQVVERTVVAQVGDAVLNQSPAGQNRLVHVLPKPGVMDPVAESALAASRELGLQAQAVSTLNKFWLSDLEDEQLATLCRRVLANDAIQQVIVGPLDFDRLQLGSSYEFQSVTVPLRSMDDAELGELSVRRQLYLTLVEMQTIQSFYRQAERDPSDVELETIAQTWSEHCSHKTLKGRIHYRDEHGERRFENMLKETIFAATVEIRESLGDEDWCVSVFEDNAGIVRFDDEHNVVFKVETHNHPSALEPYGGANTGIGGVIRDPMGTGMGAKPVCNTDVFCFAPPDTPPESLPPGVLHPRRVMKGVVSGVRDYGNRMGIPTVNGALYFDERYLGNPLVYCGNVGILPREKSHKQPQPGDRIVVIGGRTGRDGIHGATFSSTELHSESESASGGAVQIGNAITEKMVLDVVLAARDAELFNAITDCGAGGLSSAVGEMGEKIGARVDLETVPLKYEGLSYTEIWISEAQERMVLAVPPNNWDEFAALCQSEGVEATAIGVFEPTERLELFYQGQQVGDLSMAFLHDGRPPVVRKAVYQPPEFKPQPLPEKYSWDYTPELTAILGSLNVASKEWVIRQYDHEVQGGSVVKPLVGVANDGPSDAAVVRPVLGSGRGVVVACGMNPHYGDLDPYQMAASAVDEAIRNCVAVGADPARIAVLDNFCWGNTDKPEQLGTLVRAALACYDLAVTLGTPFISGKDSLNNEFRYQDPGGETRTIAIPPSLLISAMGQMDDVRRAVTMDLKQSGSFLYQIGVTRDELGGSHFALTQSLGGGKVPTVQAEQAKRTFAALHQAIQQELVLACHDLSEGGLAAAAAEMAFAGGLGARVFLAQVPHDILLDAQERQELTNLQTEFSEEDIHPLSVLPQATAALLFSESNTRFLCEVRQQDAAAFEAALKEAPCALIGEVTDTHRLEIIGVPRPEREDEAAPAETTAPLVINAEIGDLKEAWQSPLRW